MAADDVSPAPQSRPSHAAYGWPAVAASVRGVQHERSGQPNQDAFALQAAADRGLPLAVAVSDGHGSPKCFRSDAGARIAVEVATKLMLKFAETQPSEATSVDAGCAKERLPETLLIAWRDAIAQALAANELSPEELGALEAQAGTAARLAVEENQFIAYGATLLAVLLTDSFALYLQLGDGDILVVGDGGEVVRPIPRDPQLLGNETTSLCSHEAWRAAKVAVAPLAERRPALILLSSDGYANSFAHDADFLQVGADLLRIVRSAGLDTVRDNLAAWLAETSAAGSGDDITLAMICRAEANSPPSAAPLAQ